MEYRIGEIADRVGMTVEGLRFYDRRGLVRPTRRTQAGYRLYGEAELGSLRFIKAAQEMGFALREIEELMSLRDRPAESCVAVRDRLRSKLDSVRQRIRLLRAFEDDLESAVARCEAQVASGERRHCPVLEDLGADLWSRASAPSPPPAQGPRLRE